MSKIPDEDFAVWQSKQLEGISFFKANFKKFSYDRHTHDEYALGVIEEGVQIFTHKGKSWTAPAGSIITVNPDEVHDGRALSESGYRYRMLYLDPELIQEILKEHEGIREKLFFREPRIENSDLAGNLSRILNHLEKLDCREQLEAEALLYPLIAELFSTHAAGTGSRPMKKSTLSVERTLEYIKSRASSNISLEELADIAGLSRFHFLRVFKEATGCSPHFFQIQKRLQIARQEIIRGSTLRDAALNAGFSDQSHLSRRFKAAFGMTPGQFQKIQN